jgi:hypothetical protein
MLGYPSPAETLREREAPSGLRSSTQPTLFKVFGQNLRSIGIGGVGFFENSFGRRMCFQLFRINLLQKPSKIASNLDTVRL